MKLFIGHPMIVPMGLTILLSFAPQEADAQGMIVRDRNGMSGVYVNGNGRGMAGTFDNEGFEGVMMGPDGRVRRITGQPTANPFDRSDSSSRDFRRMRRMPIRGTGAFAGAGVGPSAPVPGSFDPFEFVFGRSGRPFQGVGVRAGNSINQEWDRSVRKFQRGRYQGALKILDPLHRDLPQNPDIAQLKGLALFALGDYKEAAAAVYPILATEGTWDWTTIRSFYDNEEDYIRQLRKLEKSARKHPKATPTQFLLAYHGLILNQTEMAREALKNLGQQLPEDPVVEEMISSLPPILNAPAGNPNIPQ